MKCLLDLLPATIPILYIQDTLKPLAHGVLYHQGMESYVDKIPQMKTPYNAHKNGIKKYLLGVKSIFFEIYFQEAVHLTAEIKQYCGWITTHNLGDAAGFLGCKFFRTDMTNVCTLKEYRNVSSRSLEA